MEHKEQNTYQGISRQQVFLVTGAAGFIGSHICEHLLNRGDTVIGIDNLNSFYDPQIKQDNISEIEKNDRKSAFHFHKGDIRDADFLNDIFSTYRVDGVIHLAAYAGVRPSIADPKLYADVNIMGTVNLLEAMRRHQVKRHVFASSSSVYGNSRKIPFSEQDPVDKAVSPYAATKKAGEVICHTYHHLYGINTACLRFFTVYGPRQRPDLAIHKFTRLMLDGKPIPFFGDGSMRRDHTYIDDIADGVLKAVDWTAAGNLEEGSGTAAKYDIFNLGESRTITLNELVEAISAVTGIEPLIDRQPVPPGDVECTYADITHAREVLGYNPKTELEDGLRHFREWLAG